MRPASRKPLGAAVGAAIGALILATSLSGPFGLVLAETPNDGKEITYNVSFGAARAYAYQASVSPTVIRVAGLDPCKPESDPYACDSARYNHTPNCPAGIALGPNGPSRVTEPPPGVVPETKGPGHDDLSPPEPSPVKINDLAAIVKSITRSGVVLLSSGMASDSYVDASGRDNPEAHAESDGLSALYSPWEERCWSGRDSVTNEIKPIDPKSYLHLYTRSGPGPDTYQLAECREGQCTFGGTSSSGDFSAERAETITWVREEGGIFKARLSAYLEGVEFPPGRSDGLTADSLFTLITFETDGTAQSLKWSAVTSASNVRIGGVPTQLSPGSDPQSGTIPGINQNYTAGVAAPIVSVPADGSSATIKAPGMVIAVDNAALTPPSQLCGAIPPGQQRDQCTAQTVPIEGQTAFLGGAELAVGSIGRETPFSFLATNFATDTFFGSGGGFEVTTGAPLTGSTVSDEGRVVSIRELSVMPWPLISIFSFGTLALLVLLAGWLRRFAWGRQMFRHQPLRTIDWLYRAFVRT